MRLVRCASAVVVVSLVSFSAVCLAATADRITQPIVPQKTARVAAGIPVQAQSQFDRGPVDPSMKLDYITLLTAPTQAQKKALDKLLAEQQDPHSPYYHKWLTPEEYADQFGLSSSDINKLTTWLTSQGFTIVRTARGRNWIAFSGTAALVEKAFQTEIHRFEVDGEIHFSNTTPPVIPTSFSGVVIGLRGLNDFRPKSHYRRSAPGYTFPFNGGEYLFIAPGDVKTIYDVATLYDNGIDGTGYSLAVVGQTGIYESDLTNFRQNFGLSAITCPVDANGIIGQTACNTSNFKYILVNGAYNTISSGDLPEADLDLEWSGATARNAKIIFVNAPSGFGTWDAWYYAVDNNVAPVITMSYTAPCEFYESGTGEGTISSDEAELAKANSEGITFMNSAGDTGAAECDNYGITGTNTAIAGYAVAYPASSKYVTGVGGTLIPYSEFTQTYWGASNGSDGGSALSYIPEQVWNDPLEFAYYCEANKTDSFCSSNGVGGGPLDTDWEQMQVNVLGIGAGGGGVSNCAVMDANGVCQGGFPQPAWQSGLNVSAINPSGAGQANATLTRMSPDVSLLASSEFPGFLVCTQLSAIGGTGTGSSCDSPTTGISDMLTACLKGTEPCSIFGGTSFSSPIFAGMVVLFNQNLVSKGIQKAPGLGNINPTLYSLAAANATNGAFNPVTTSSTGSYTNAAWCSPGTPSSGVPGDPWPTAMQCPSSGTAIVGFNSYDSDATTGYNLATGLGSVNASHLAAAMAGTGAATTTTLSTSGSPSDSGDPVTFTAVVTTSGKSAPTGTVTFNSNGSSIGTSILSTVGGVQTATFTIDTLAPGTDSITAVYGGDANNASSTSNTISQVVNNPTFTVSTPTPITSSVPPGETATSTFTVTPGAAEFGQNVTFACSGLPYGTTCSFAPLQIQAGSPKTTVTVTVSTTGPFSGTANGIRRPQSRAASKRQRLLLPLSLPLVGIVFAGLVSPRIRRRYRIAGICAAVALAAFLIACGSSNSENPVAVSVSPASVNTLWPNLPGLSTSQTQQFTATVTNSTNTAVNWAITAGGTNDTISSTGLYTAPTAWSQQPVTITATSQANATSTGTATVMLREPTPAGTTPITVTVTEGSVSQTTTLNLTVGN
jgi:Pro-kumamolisin, activation domain/Bacterial Ig-like domain (group 3)